MNFIKVEPHTILNGMPYFIIDHPTFLDHNLQAKSVIAQKLTVSEFKKIFDDSTVYIMSILKYDDDPEGIYSFRFCAVSKLEPNLTFLNEINIIETISCFDQFETIKEISLKLKLEVVNDFVHTWGYEEITKRIGKELEAALTRNKCETTPSVAISQKT